MKEIEVTASKGDHVGVCPTCKKIMEDVTAYFYVPDYHRFPPANGVTPYPQMIKIPFKPVEQCQCQKEQQR